MSFIETIEKAELAEKLNPKVNSWNSEREKAVKDIPYVVDINPRQSRRKDQDQWDMYQDSYDSFLNR
jgi:hypothetical protein